MLKRHALARRVEQSFRAVRAAVLPSAADAHAGAHEAEQAGLKARVVALEGVTARGVQEGDERSEALLLFGEDGRAVHDLGELLDRAREKHGAGVGRARGRSWYVQAVFRWVWRTAITVRPSLRYQVRMMG